MNKKRALIFSILTVAVIVAGFVSFFTTNRSKFLDPRLDQIYVLRDIRNNRIASVHTDFLIINFWASWCPPCIEETPSLIRFTEKYASHFTLLALSQDTTKKEIEDFIKLFPSLRSPFVTVVHDDSQSIARSFKVEKLPETFIYSIKENKYFQISGSTNWDQPDIINTLNTYFKINLQN